MATVQRLETALRNADAAGDTEAARKIAQALRAKMKEQSQAQPMEQPQPARRARRDRGIFGSLPPKKQEPQFTGQDIERTPSLFQSDFLADLPRTEQAKIVGLAQMTPDQNELAEIIKAQVPDTEITYNRDQEGNVYPVLRRPDGRVAMIDKPGIDALNVAQFATDMAMFTPAGRTAGMLSGVAGATATESARQGVQATAGGEFDVEDVAMAGGLEAGGRVAEKALGAAYRGLRGKPSEEVQEVLQAGEAAGVPIMTTDIAEPRTIFGRAARTTAENVPVFGTGGMRASQQEARVQAVDDFIDRYQGGSYEQIIQSMKDQRDRIKSAAAKTYNRVVPKVDAAIQRGDGIPFTNTSRAIERARETLTRPGRKQSPRALDLLAEIQESVQVPSQSFGTLKSNISSWQEALQSVDPALRDQLPTEDKRVLESVLKAMRQDRDEVAQSALSSNEFRQLKNADAAYGEMANQMKNRRIRNVLNQGDTTPEIARNLLFSNKPSEIKQIYGALTDDGRATARATIISDIADRLRDRASGITPDNLATELGKRRELLDVFFRGPRRKELNGFLRMLKATSEASAVNLAQRVPTGQQLVPLALGYGFYVDPVIAGTLSAAGALGKIYEKPKVRSILARMSSVEPGSTEFEKLVSEFRKEATGVAQAIRSEQSEESEQ